MSSHACFKGLCKKGVILLIVFIGELVDQAMGAAYVRIAVIFFFAGNKGISLLENLGLMGVPFPPAMQKALEALQKIDNATGRKGNQYHESKSI